MTNSPNVLFVFSDQHRAVDLGCYGNPAVSSPLFDRFASQGARIETCVATSPVCVPMRGSLLTGLHAWNHGALTNDLPIRPGLEGIGHVFRGAGYHTGYIGKWHLGGVPRDRAIPREERLGFEEWKVANCTHDYSHSYYHDEDDVRHEYEQFEPVGQTDLAVDFLRRAAGSSAGNSRAGDSRRSGAKPWALFLSWGPPHAPYNDVPDEYRRLFDASALELRSNVPDTNWDGTDRAAIREWIAGYYAHIKQLDDQFGRLLSTLEELGIVEDTLVVYTSDHGDMLGSHGMTKKQLPFDESIRVPLLARLPGRIEPGSRGGVFGLVDLAPTVLGLCGLSFSNAVDGVDRSLVLAGGAYGERVYSAQAIRVDETEAALIYNLVPCHQAADRGDRGGWVGVRTPRHTYARWDSGECFHLFDNDTDPYQLRNLCANGEAGYLEETLKRITNRELERAGYRFRRWQEMIIEDGYVEEWNRSQRYFGRPELSGPDSSP